ncbi:MAG TPA: hypothetical protein VNE39_19790 [Planctomycetota bacterium]|nr:hypothetical protein [Planctomycetota bacterium]
MRIQVTLAQQRFLARASMLATVTIENDGREPLDVPDPGDNTNRQPTYTVEGPSCPGGHTFHARGAVHGDPRASVEGEHPATIRLAPSEAHAAEVSVDQLVKLSKPGRHTLSAALEWGGKVARSQPVEFLVEDAAFTSFQLVTAAGLQEEYPIRLFCLQKGGAAGEVYVALLNERDPETGLVTLAGLSRLAPADAGAETVFGPWMNCAGFGAPSPRAGWQAGNLLGVADFPGTEVQRIALPTPPLLVRPAVTPATGEMDVFVVNASARSLALLRFPMPQDGGQDAPRSLWAVPLPSAPLAARAAIGPAGRGNARVAVFLVKAPEGLQAVLADAGAGTTAPRLRTVAIEGKHALPASEIAVRVADDGSVHAAALVAEDAQATRLCIADATWSPDAAAPGQVSVAAAATTLPGPSRASAVGYSVAPGGPPRRDWAVLLGGSRILSSASPHEPHTLQGTVVVPIEMLAMSRLTYVLTRHPEDVVRLERVH